MLHPYQCLTLCHRATAAGSVKLFLAACGPQLLVVNADTSDILSTWSGSEKQNGKADAQEEKDSSPEIKLDEPPKKKRKTAPEQAAPAITKITTTKDGNHVVATTGEDKSVLVFTFDEKSSLQLLSQRRMPKRPCAVVMSPDEKTILIGDKFGDVYGLPLHPPASDSVPTKVVPEEQPAPAPRPFKPSATDLTVHTGRNRKALEAQMKQPKVVKEPDSMAFAHELLLGHVSMLTDIACVSIPVKTATKTHDRTYILTADRDEHIRVSRGPPQAHIIDSYCFGHTSFVSSLCLLPRSENTILVSGGGDDYLLIWDWRQSTILGRIDLRAALAQYEEDLPVRSRKNKKVQAQTANDEAMLLQDSREAMGKAEQSTDPEGLADEQADEVTEEKIAVAGLWAEQLDGNVDRTDHTSVFCALEGVPALFQFVLPTLKPTKMDASAIQLHVLQLGGNCLDVVVDKDWLYVTTDNLHEPGTTKETRKSTGATSRLQCISLASPTELQSSDKLEKLLNEYDGIQLMDDAKELKAVGDLLYNVENLRKRGGEEA